MISDWKLLLIKGVKLSSKNIFLKQIFPYLQDFFGIGATFRVGQEILCLLYAGFFSFLLLSFFQFFWYMCYYLHTSTDSVSPVCKTISSSDWWRGRDLVFVKHTFPVKILGKVHSWQLAQLSPVFAPMSGVRNVHRLTRAWRPEISNMLMNEYI